MRSPRFYIVFGLFLVVLFIGSLASWAIFARLNGAVLSTGELAYTSGRVIEVVHPDGGEVDDLFVMPGDRVEAGEVLLRFDDDLLLVEARIVRNRLFEAQLRVLRLRASLENESFPDLPEDMRLRVEENPDLEEVVAREVEALRLSSDERSAIDAQYEDRRRQVRLSVESLRELVGGLEVQESLLEEEWQVQRDLEERGVARRPDVSRAQREFLSVRNDRLELMSEIERQETELGTLEGDYAREIAQRDVRFSDSLSGVSETIPELEERLVALNAQLKRLDVRAPVSGVLSELMVLSSEVVLLPGSVVGVIIPQNESPVLLGRIDPTQVNEIHVGQEALVRPLTRAYNDMELVSVVERISEGLRIDERTGVGYYEIILRPSLSALEERGASLISGMPFEVAIQTQARSPFSYFMEPVYRSFRRAFKE